MKFLALYATITASNCISLKPVLQRSGCWVAAAAALPIVVSSAFHSATTPRRHRLPLATFVSSHSRAASTDSSFRRCHRALNGVESRRYFVAMSELSSSPLLPFSEDNLGDGDRQELSSRDDCTNEPKVWTVCNVCNGEGRTARKRWSKKARYKHQQKAKLSATNDKNDTATPPPPSPSPLQRLTDVCKTCTGSGLQRKAVPTAAGTAASASVEGGTSSTVGGTMPQIQLQPLQVAIIGGGIAGLALAAALQHRQPYFNVRLYERDVSFDERRQGYGLTLQQAAPQLSALGITVPLAAGITSTKHIVHDAQGNVMGTWGMRHWKGDSSGCSSRNDDNNSSSTTTSNPNSSCTKQNRPDRVSESSDSAVNGTTAVSDSTHRRKRQNVHIARQALRYELYKAATANEHPGEESVIQWGHRLIGYQGVKDKDRGCDGGVQLTFAVSKSDRASSSTADETVVEYADLVVGADGIRSQVRQQLVPSNNNSSSNDQHPSRTSAVAAVSTASSALPLRYLECMVILGICPLALVMESKLVSSSPFAHLLDGETVFQTADGVTRMYMMPFSKTEYMWQLSFPFTEPLAIQLSSQGPAALQQEAVQRCGAWHSPIPEILSATPVDLVSGYPVYDHHPLVQADELQRSHEGVPRRVTCVGDAIHCMSPFKGQGANQALLDALSLARTLHRTFVSKMIAHDKAIKGSNDDDDDNNNNLTSLSLPARVLLEAQDIEDAILEYEAEMLQRSAVKVQASADAAHFLHTSIAIQEGNVTRGAAAAAASSTSSKLAAVET